MKHLKMIGLALVAAAAFMAFAGNASANPTLTSPSGTEFTGPLTATATKGGSLLLKATFANVTCTESTVSGNVTTNNTEHAAGAITTLSFSGCGTINHVTPLKNADGTYGSLTVKPNGEVLGSNTNVTIKNTTTGAHCVFGTTTNTKLGTLTPSSGSPATTAVMHISASLPYNSALSTSSSFVCGSTGSWSGTYTVTTPDPLYLA